MVKNKIERICGACLHLMPHHYSKKGNLICSRCSRVYPSGRLDGKDDITLRGEEE